MEPITVGDLVFKILLPLLLGVIGYLLVDLRTSVKEQLRAHEARLKEQGDKLAALEADLPVQYVRREEFVRQSVQIDRKLDLVMEKLDELPCKHRRRGGDRECDAV